MAAWIPFVLGALNAAGSLMQSNATVQSEAANAAIAKTNAALSIQNAAMKADQLRRLSRKHLGTMRAQFGAAGGMSGSALDVMADSAMQAELDILTAKYQGDVEALGFSMESKAARKRAESASRAAPFGALSSFASAFLMSR